MRRKTFDFSRIAPGRNKWGRVRQESDKVTMTVKEIRGSGINDTYEVELVVNDFEAAAAFFEACDIPAKAFQENMREVWVRDGVEVTIDTWPGLNPFVEVEGKDEKVVREMSKELGFNFEKAVFGSIDLVYEKELGILAQTIIRLPEITFANPPKKNAADFDFYLITGDGADERASKRRTYVEDRDFFSLDFVSISPTCW
jgi:adenylate cyclase class 2